jgi:hypothetical protein
MKSVQPSFLLRRGFSALALGTAFLAPYSIAQAQVTVRQATGSGPYDAVTVELNGPNLDEAKGVNPFADYRLDVTFTDGQKSSTVPGYFQGCADAADRGCTGGRLWRAHFVPTHGGAYSYSVRFRSGADIAPNGAASTHAATRTPGTSRTGSTTLARARPTVARWSISAASTARRPP